MNDETRDLGNSSLGASERGSDSVEVGVALVLQAEDRGDWQPLAQWLAAHPEAAGEVGEFLAAQKKLRLVVEPVAAPPEPAGTTVGRYVLREEIGRGGSAIVYRAFDTKRQHDVALKLVRTGEASTGERARFQYESLRVASLRHPNIVSVYDFDADGDTPYIAMPLMTGGSLADRLKSLGPDRRLPAKEAAQIVRDIALGVHHAHQRGLIHRDLKPGNILLDAADTPHVADFGLARLIDTTASIPGAITGTVPYMAPEQARGEAVLTTAVDVHALGVLLFELLTGRTPFGSGDIASILRRVIEDAAPPVRQFRPEVERDLEAVCLKCLEKQPGARYASTQELADDLDRYLTGGPVKARPRGLFAEVVGAYRWERESPSFVTWRGFAYGALNTVVNHAVIAALAFAGYPRAAFAVFLYHLLTWAAFVWWFAIRDRSRMTAVERSGLALHIGGILAVAITLPIVVATRGSDIAGVYPLYNAILGCMTFAHGAIHLGRHYLTGLFWMLQNLLLPFLPVWAWPVVHAAVGGAFHVWAAVVLWRIDRAGRAASAQPTG